jgi:hypothetical protein
VTTDLVWAVVDGPTGHQAVGMPADRAAAQRLKLQHNERFWCGLQAAGCGSRLFVIAGEQRRPHFRHEQHAACRFIDRPGAAVHAYEHLRYQEALQAWLRDQGHQPRLEKYLASDGRTDLHVIIDAVAHIIEVQLSPLGVGHWQERDRRYHRHAEHVTWVYGPGAAASAATELAARGVALRLRAGPEVGVQDVDGGMRWSALTPCALLATGFHAPGLAEARALHEQRLREQAEAGAESAAEEAERERAAQTAREAWPVRQVPTRQPLPPVRAPLSAAPKTLQEWERLYPEAAGWAPSGGWGWLGGLRAELQPAARAMAYATQVLLAGGPTSGLLAGMLQDSDRQEIVLHLERLGMLVRDVALPSGIERWSRGG